MERTPAEPRILVLRFHSLGDVVLTTGVVRALAGGEREPNRAAVEVATAAEFAPVFRGLPWISRVWTREELERAAAGGARSATGDGSPKASAPRPFDRVIDLQGTPGSRRLAARLGRRLGVRTRSASRRWVVFWGDRFPRPQIPHAVARYAEAADLDAEVEAPGPDAEVEAARPVARVTPEELAEATRAHPALFASPAQTAVALLHGASRRTKEYPAPQLIAVGEMLEAAGVPVWWIESPASSSLDGASFSGGALRWPRIRQPLGPLKAVLAHAALVVASDSGPMHLASALGTPVLALFGSSVPAFGFTPAGESDRVLGVADLACRPCSVHGRGRCWQGHWRCLRDLAPARVGEEAMRMLHALGRNPTVAGNLRAVPPRADRKGGRR